MQQSVCLATAGSSRFKYLQVMITMMCHHHHVAPWLTICPCCCCVQASVWNNVVLRGDLNNITIGQVSNVQDRTVIHAARYGAKAICTSNSMQHLKQLVLCPLEHSSVIWDTSSSSCSYHLQKLLSMQGRLTVYQPHFLHVWDIGFDGSACFFCSCCCYCSVQDLPLGHVCGCQDWQVCDH